MARRRSSHLQTVGGTRQRYFELATQTTDPDLRDLYLATGEAKTAKGLQYRYGDKTQDPRDVDFSETQVPPQENPMDEAYWLAGNLALTQTLPEHGWPMSDPAIEI